ncbi:MAG TPA: response regulator [Nitrospira sp.]|jgi:DNA-binding NarL/FixJ family response regulator|nr:response regulator [Nitrospira sp.]
MLVSVDGNQGTSNGFVSSDPSTRRISADEGRTSQYRILVVDDDQETRQLLQDILEKYPDVRIVGQAGDGKEAVAMAIEHKPDVILMDVALPYLDGIEATHCIKKACPDTVVICLTGHFSPPKYSAMRTAGAAAFVCKNQVLAIHETIMSALGQWTRWE